MGKLPSAAALMKPGALRDGTSATTPFITPMPFSTFQVPVDCPPMTGSFSSLKVKVVPGAPSKVTSGTCETG